MAEDTSTEDPSEQAPAALESEAKPSDDAAPKAEADEPASEGLDPQLIVLCLVLWFVAGGIIISRWSSLKTDWYLGNVKTTLGPLPPPSAEGQPPKLDEASIRALVQMADDADVVGALAEELDNRAQIDQRYRAIMIEIAKRIGDSKALTFIADRGAIDYDYRVRANSYLALASLGPTAEGDLREKTFLTLQRALLQEPESIARSVAAGGLGEFKDPRATWDLIKTLRDAKGDYAAQLRGGCVNGLRKITGQDESALPVDPNLEGEAFDAQVQGWEDWFKATGGTIPAGESLREVREAEAAAAEDAQGDETTTDESTEDPAEETPAGADAEKKPE